MAPYLWIENDRFTKTPSIQYPGSGFPVFIRKGPQADDLKFEEALDVLANRAIAYLHKMAKAKERNPFFLYLPLTGPHKPVVPHPRFKGKTKLGPYGDFVMNVDDCVGQILKALDKFDLAKNSLVIFTSDNGSFMYSKKNERDHVTDPSIQSYDPSNHRANGKLRGTKADIWEAGHRVPFFARWPGEIQPGSKTENTICHVDLLATAAEVSGAIIPKGAAIDSHSFLPLLKGKEKDHLRPPVINHSAGGTFAIRNGNWKLVLGNGSGGRQAPKGKPFQRPYHLFNLATDLAETSNQAEKEIKVVQRLENLLQPILRKEAK
jgi:arylsulfatase A-like enzyme